MNPASPKPNNGEDGVVMTLHVVGAVMAAAGVLYGLLEVSSAGAVAVITGVYAGIAGLLLIGLGSVVQKLNIIEVHLRPKL